MITYHTPIRQETVPCKSFNMSLKPSIKDYLEVIQMVK